MNSTTANTNTPTYKKIPKFLYSTWSERIPVCIIGFISLWPWQCSVLTVITSVVLCCATVQFEGTASQHILCFETSETWFIFPDNAQTLQRNWATVCYWMCLSPPQHQPTKDVPNFTKEGEFWCLGPTLCFIESVRCGFLQQAPLMNDPK